MIHTGWNRGHHVRWQSWLGNHTSRWYEVCSSCPCWTRRKSSRSSERLTRSGVFQRKIAKL